MPTIVIECSDIAGSRRMGTILQDHGHRLDVRRLHRGDPVPVDVTGVDAVLCFGGPQSSNDDSLPWMEPLKAFLRAVHEADVPIFGICLGSQVLARALGGQVATMPDGPRLGWHDIVLTAQGREDPLFKGQPWTLMQFHWNRDSIVEVPEGGSVLAIGDRDDIQAWSLGVRSYGVQFHPEIESTQVATWAEDDAALMADLRMERERLQQETDRRYSEFARLTDRFFETIAMLLMPLDRRVDLVGHMP